MIKYFFNDLGIGMRLRISFIIVLLAILIISFLGQFNFNRAVSLSRQTYEVVTVPMGSLVELSLAYGNVRASVREFVYSATDADHRAYEQQAINSSLSTLNSTLDSYIATLQSNPSADAENLETSRALRSALTDYSNVINNKLIPLALDNQTDIVFNIISTELSQHNKIIGAHIETLMDINILHAQHDANTMSSMASLSSFTQIGILIAVILFGLFLVRLLIAGIVVPLSTITLATTELAKGNLNINTNSNSKDELGVLSRNFMTLTSSINDIIVSMDEMAHQHTLGDIEHFIEVTRFQGSFRTVVEGVNDMVDSHIRVKKNAMGCVEAIGKGDFSATIDQLPGKKAFINGVLNNLSTNIKGINLEISDLINTASAGNLSKRIDVNKYSGDWAKLMSDLNNFINTVVTPINEVSGVVSEMSKGNLSARMSGDYNGDFLALKENINSTLGNINSYINEISGVLGELSNKNFNQSVSREYVGDFGAIKIALNGIITQLNTVMGRISTATSHIDAGSKSISESSMNLAEGASQQSAALSNLTDIVSEINEKTKISAENAKVADKLSAQSKENADIGSKEMKNMLNAMENIKDSSNNINNIIKVIEDIAFQTNLLALNAAVESARAGVHGKGFAVVAEEVRTLAARSSTAAKETAELINDSLQRVSEGTMIATSTSEALEKIVSNVSHVSGIISDISISSDKQAESISQINTGLGKISDVVQNTNATSEENAAAAEQFSVQSDLLSTMLSEFVLKR